MSSYGGVTGATASRGTRPTSTDSSGQPLQGSWTRLGGGQGAAGGVSGIIDFVGQDVLNPGQFLSDWLGGVGSTLDWLKWLLNPLTILRAAEAFFGFVLILTGLYFLGTAATGEGESELSPEQLASTATLGVIGKGALRLGGKAPRRTTVTKRRGPAAGTVKSPGERKDAMRPVGYSSRKHAKLRREQGFPSNRRAHELDAEARTRRKAPTSAQSNDIPF